MRLHETTINKKILDVLEKCEHNPQYLVNRRIYFQNFESIYLLLPELNKNEMYKMDECVNHMIDICIELAYFEALKNINNAFFII